MTFPFRLLALGFGFAAVGGLAVWSSFPHEAVAKSAKAGSPARPTALHWFAQGPVKPLPLNRSSETAAEPMAPRAEVEAAAAFTAEITPVASTLVAFQPTREELELRALIVEQQANKQLKNLLGVLNLTDDQQDRIFSTLARHSDYYHPALQFQNATGADLSAASVAKITPPQSATPSPAAGTAATSPATADPAADAILAELEPDQVEVYERYRSERDSFWAGVVSDIEKKLDANGE